MTATAADRTTPAAATAVADPRRWLILAVVVSAAFMAVLDAFVVNVAVPSIKADFDASFAAIELVLAGYTIAYAVLLITGGRLGDLYGRKRMFMVGMAVFTVASALCGLAPDVHTLIGARVLQGAGAALMYPQVLSVIQVTFEGRERTTALGIFAGSLGLATIVGQLVGGLLIQADLWGLSWRPVFLLNVPIGVAGLVAAGAILGPLRGEAGRGLDLPGVGLVTAALLLLAVPLLEGREAGWPWWLILCLIAAVPAFGLFAVYERRRAARGESPLVDLALFRQRAFTVGILVAQAFIAGNVGLFFVLALTLQEGLGFSPLSAGMVFAPLGIGFTVASLTTPRLVGRLGRGVLRLGYLIDALGLGLAFLTLRHFGEVLSRTDLFPALFVVGVGQGLGVSPLIGTILSGIEARDAGAAAGMMSTAMQVANVLGVAIVGLVFFGILGRQEGGTEAAHYVTAFTWTLPFLAALALIAFELVSELPRPRIDVSDVLLERVPQPLAGLAYSVYLATGGRLGERFFVELMQRRIAQRAAQIAAAPMDPADYLVFHYLRGGDDPGWLTYLTREGLALGAGPIPHEEERRAVIQRLVDEVRQRQAAGLIDPAFDPAHVRLLAFALSTYPRVFAQIVRMATDLSPADPAFEEGWTRFLRQLGDRLGPTDDESA